MSEENEKSDRTYWPVVAFIILLAVMFYLPHYLPDKDLGLFPLLAILVTVSLAMFYSLVKTVEIFFPRERNLDYPWSRYTIPLKGELLAVIFAVIIFLLVIILFN